MTKDEIIVRRAEKEDIEQFMDLVMRMKRLNGEFDSLFKANEDNLGNIKNYYLSTIEHRDRFVTLVAICKKKICGLVKAEVKDRVSYIPDKEARINDLYIMPEFRRKDVGKKMLNKLYEIAREMNIRVISAEFPTLNLIALNFYQKIGYREIGSVYGVDIENIEKDKSE